MIEQPAAPEGLTVAPEGARVDLAMPTFSDPTSITNPLFPISSQHSVLMTGDVDGEPFRTEVTLLQETRVVSWEGQSVETLVSQYVAYLGGRVHEVAYDLYAQADDGSVWYFGEDVYNFANGAIVNTHGTWHAGADGPAAMIMPADPQVGDVYRPENIPGLVFEEVTVTKIDQTFDGPFGPISGGIEISELHMDGGTEGKTFAPGYGEFWTSDGTDTEELAVAVPTDASDGPIPAELEAMTAGTAAVVEAARTDDWDAASAALDEIVAAWEAYSAGDVPLLIEPVMTDAVDALEQAIDAREGTEAEQAAILLAQTALDLQLLHRSPAEIDLARGALWATQLIVDAEAEDAGAVNGDALTLDYIRDRIGSVLGDAEAEVNQLMEDLHGAVGDEDFAAVIDIAEQLRQTLEGVIPAA
ncbi:MAG: hypothetical protein ACRDGJ_08525 [Candidatus Limnocylindria bacterium]